MVSNTRCDIQYTLGWYGCNLLSGDGVELAHKQHVRGGLCIGLWQVSNHLQDHSPVLGLAQASLLLNVLQRACILWRLPVIFQAARIVLRIIEQDFCMCSSLAF
jgi:hypothetical protein